MSVRVERAGPQTTIQAGPRTGRRHLGVPASGAADALSLALANRLVGNRAFAAGLEVTLQGPILVFDTAARIAVTGADADIRLNGADCPLHTTLQACAGDRLEIGACSTGARTYVAIAGGFAAQTVLGSVSTYLPAALGGHHGRALAAGDRLQLAGPPWTDGEVATPPEFRPVLVHGWALRVCAGAEAGRLTRGAREALADTNWIVGRRADRMGQELLGTELEIDSAGRLPSAPVFPGTVQLPENGVPFLLGVDAQTTGGYPRIAQVARCDRHLIGQLSPGDRVRFLAREPRQAALALQEKHAYWQRWLPEIASVI